MPIREKSFRIGSGRYLQEAGILNTLGSEVLRFGRSPLILGGKRALEITREIIEKSVAASCEKYKIIEYTGTCNDECAKKYAEVAGNEGFDVIVGVGGGVMMDFAKLVAHFASLPVINAPTSSATCAAYTPLSVRYTPDGRTVGTMHYEKEVDAVIADTEILANQPVRLLLSGVFDSIAKFVEIKQRFSEDASDYPLGLDWAYVMSVHSYKELFKKSEPCIADMAQGIVSSTVEQVIFTAIAATGVISGIARGSNQTAVAHKFYEATRTLFYNESRGYLHGEIVGVGLLLQNFFNGESEANRELLSIMKKYDMPYSASSIGIPKTKEALELYYDKLCTCSAITEGGEDAPAKLKASLDYLFSIE